MESKGKPEKDSFNRYRRLSGIGLQMVATIFLGAFLGRYLDDKYPMEKKWWTIGLTIFAVGVALYNVLKKVNQMNDED